MSLTLLFRAAAVAAALTLAPGLLAAPACSTFIAKPRLPVAVLTAPASGSVVQAKDCASDCAVATLPAGEVSFALPTPTYWPAVSPADEIAAWHVEIFERLTDARSRPTATQVCRASL